MNIDRTDRKILKFLQQNGRMSNAELSNKINLSHSACFRRVKLLEESGIIESYVAILNQQKIGKSMTIFVEISLLSQSSDSLLEFEAAVEKSSEIQECFLMAGNADYLLKLSASDANDFERIHRDHLSKLPGVSRMRSSFAIRKVVHKTEYDLEN